MSLSHLKHVRVRLDAKAYTRLRWQIFQRDGWRCQHCGSMSELQSHHIRFRSHLGDDRKENLITVCANCHGRLHGTPSK